MKKLFLFIGILGVFFVLIRLGFWQWERGEAKAALLQAQELVKAQHAQLPKNTLSEAQKHQLFQAQSKQMVWHWVTMKGHFDPKHSFFWANKFRNHQLGVEVLTPFYLDCVSDQALSECLGVILVNRGWVSAKQARDAPESLIALPTNSTMVAGQLVLPERGILLGKNLEHAWPKSMQAWVFSELKPLFTVKLSPYMLRLSENNGGGFDREWSQPGMSPARHRMYAYQWWLFAVVWAIGVIVLIRREKHAK